MNKGAKYLISLALLFHLTAVFIFPNPDSMISRQLSWLFYPYGNFLGLNTTWRFFSPNPLLHRLEYRAFSYDENGEEVFYKTAFFPESVEWSGSRESFIRMMNYAMLTASQTRLVDNVLKAFFCRETKGAQEIELYSVNYELPSLEKAQIISGELDDLVNVRRNSITQFSCQERTQ